MSMSYTDRSRSILHACSPEVLGLLRRIDAAALYPPFLAKVAAALEAQALRGRHFWVTAGLRTWEQQAELYKRGRRGIKGEGKVTTVDAGQSAHNYGIAVDACFDTDIKKPGLQPSWDKAELKLWADAAVEQGLDAGFYWKNFFDGPHVQLDIRKYGLSPRKQLMKAYKKGGSDAVFKLLDTYDWS